MKNKAKNILFLPQWYPNKFDNMWGLFVKKHAEAANRLNNISILYLHAIDNIRSKTEIIESQDNGILTLYVYYSKPKYKLLYLFKLLKEYRNGISIIQKKQNIDLIHVHILTRAGILALLSRITLGIPYIITEHWSRYLNNVGTYNGALRKILTKTVAKNAQAILPVTQNLKEALISHQIKNEFFKIIPNVVDEMFFQQKLKQNNNKIKRVIHVSTFEDKSKNITGIINMVNKLSKIRDDFKVILIGDGIDFNSLKNYANSLKLENCIEFTGLLEKNELVEEYINASFMIINSNYENMPVVINEAMACGLPVLSTNVGGIHEHLDSKKGRLFKPKQPQELADQFQWMLDHLDSFEPSSIRHYAQEHFSYDAVGRQLDEIYNTVVKEK